LAFLLVFAAAAAVAAGPASPWSKKPIGVLLIGPGGGADWQGFLREVKKAYPKNFPLEAYAGSIATRDIQRALDRLKAAKVEKIVAVPLYLSSQSPEIEQLKYILGLAKFPSGDFMDSWGMHTRVIPRAKVPAPLVLTWALDADPVVAEVLLARAAEMSRAPAKEAVVLLTEGFKSDNANQALDRRLVSLTRAMRKNGGYSVVRAVPILPGTDKAPRREDDSWKQVRAAIRNLSISNRVILVPYMLHRDGTERAWRKELDNLFFRWKGQGLLPDKRLARWVTNQVRTFKKQDDMVRYKDNGQAVPPARGRRDNK